MFPITLLVALVACPPPQPPGPDPADTGEPPPADSSTSDTGHPHTGSPDTGPGDPAAPPPLSLLRIDAHGHPSDRAEDGEIAWDDGEAMLTVARSNNLAAVLASQSFWPQDEHRNGEVLESLADRAPEVVPLLWIHPETGSASEAETWLRDHAFAGLKLHPTSDGIEADSPLLDPYLEVAARYGVPLVVHTADDPWATPTQVGTLAARHPTVPVVLYHAGLGTDHAEAIQVVEGCPNCLLEISWTTWGDADAALAALGSDRVLFGTDVSVDGADHYEQDWGSGAGDGSWDAWLVAAGTTLPRADWRRLLVENTVDTFHLVTIHAHRPGAARVALTLDLGDGPLSRTFPMLDEGDGWWRRTLPAPRGARFQVEADGARAGDLLEATGPECWEAAGALTDPPPATILRFHADVGWGHSLWVRGSGWPLSWDAGEPAAWVDGAWTLTLGGLTGPREVKALVDDATWESGSNHRVEPGDELDLWPTLAAP